MNDSRSDAELVTAYLGGASDALAAIYDRYADPLHDTAAVMMRDRHEAADLTQDVFLVAAERLGQLRDRSRLKPWLFAVLRNEVYRRTKRRARTRPVDFSTTDPGRGVIEMPAIPDPAAEAGAVAYEQLASDVRTAAAGLDERDQLVLELTARHGLSGEDLAAALGVTVDQSYVVVHRMRDRVERSLGALAVAKAGRRDCAELATMLAGWDGEYTVLVRKRVARHIERCTVCTETRRRFAALPLVALAPAIGAPAELRASVLRALAAGRQSPARRDEFSESTGFPRPLGASRRVLPRLAASAAVLLALAGAVGVLLARSSPTIDGDIALDDPVETVAAMAGTTELGLAVASSEPETTTATTLPSIVTDPPTVAPTPPPTPPSTTTTTTDPPDPPITGQFVIVTAADTQAPDVTITQDRPTVACPWSAPIIIAATVTDVSAVDEVTLSWSGPGSPGSTPMSRSGNSWSATLGIDQVGGVWTYVIAATDAAGNTGTASGTTVVAGC